MPSLVLASTSRYRRELLARLGLPFEAVAPACDEEALKDPELGPRELAQLLARAKAISVAPRFPDAYVLGADQLVEIDGEILGKPGSAQTALEQLERLAGKAHRIITAFALIAPDGSCEEHLDVHTLYMRDLSAAELGRYVSADSPIDCAGSYKIESRAMTLFEKIDGTDFTAIIGLPLIALTDRLRAHGFEVP